jgi:hypothetical protein
MNPGFRRLTKSSIVKFSTILLTLSFNLVYSQEAVFNTDCFELKINDRGRLTSLRDTVNNIQYLTDDIESVLLKVQKFDSDYTDPVSLKVDRFDFYKSELILEYPDSVSAKVEVVLKDGYLAFELISIEPENDIEFVKWGPYHTDIDEIVGTAVGVVRNENYGIGIQSLNMKTLGGYEINKNNRFGNTAESMEQATRLEKIKIKEGSRLQAHSKNRTINRIAKYNRMLRIHESAIPGETVVGSKIAIFGCPAEKVLDMIGAIEIYEGLPHPVIDGEWVKKSKKANSSKFIVNFSEQNIDECLSLAKKAGIKYVYHQGIWESWGHFGVNKNSFPNGYEGVRACVEKAEKEGIKLGAHTLSSFIKPWDPYITPKPHPHLAVECVTKLVSDIERDAIEILVMENPHIDSSSSFIPDRFNPCHVVRIGDELIEYESVEGEGPFVLKNCTRGAFDTKVSEHKKGDKVSKLVTHAYRVFFPDIVLLPEVARNLAKAYNLTGLKYMSLDGHEGCAYGGHGAYAIELFAKTFYDELRYKSVINNSSELDHFHWHMVSNMSWGEPWYGNFRGSMTDYRFKRADYLKDNYVPVKLGQYSFDKIQSVSDIEWLLATCAGFEAGFDVYISPEQVEEHPHGEEILAAIKKWLKAIEENAFSENEKEILRNPRNEFKLNYKDGKWELNLAGQWNPDTEEVVSLENQNTIKDIMLHGIFDSKQISITEDFKHASLSREPGEPSIMSEWDLYNPFSEQPLQFVVRLPSEAEEYIKNIILNVDGTQRTLIPVELRPGQYLVADGQGRIRIYDTNHEQLQEINVKLPIVNKGSQKINFDYERIKESSGPELTVNFISVLSNEQTD